MIRRRRRPCGVCVARGNGNPKQKAYNCDILHADVGGSRLNRRLRRNVSVKMPPRLRSASKAGAGPEQKPGTESEQKPGTESEQKSGTELEQKQKSRTGPVQEAGTARERRSSARKRKQLLSDSTESVKAKITKSDLLVEPSCVKIAKSDLPVGPEPPALNEYVLAHLFSYLGRKDRLTCELVCRSWRACLTNRRRMFWTGTQTNPQLGFKSEITACHIEGTTLFCGLRDGSLYYVELQGPDKPQLMTMGHKTRVQAIVSSKKFLLTCSAENMILWNLANLTCLDNVGESSCLAIHKDKVVMLSRPRHGCSILFWRIRPSQRQAAWQRQADRHKQVCRHNQAGRQKEASEQNPSGFYLDLVFSTICKMSIYKHSLHTLLLGEDLLLTANLAQIQKYEITLDKMGRDQLIMEHDIHIEGGQTNGFTRHNNIRRMCWINPKESMDKFLLLTRSRLLLVSASSLQVTQAIECTIFRPYADMFVLEHGKRLLFVSQHACTFITLKSVPRSADTPPTIDIMSGSSSTFKKLAHCRPDPLLHMADPVFVAEIPSCPKLSWTHVYMRGMQDSMALTAVCQKLGTFYMVPLKKVPPRAVALESTVITEYRMV